MNLALAVGPPDASGMHPIASWMAPIDVWDDIMIERSGVGGGGGGSSYRIEWADDAPVPSPIDWAAEDDLTARAHRAMEAAVGRSLPIALRVRKRIPAGGGLGGGSSDAATVMLSLCELFEIELSEAALRRVSAPIGSDIAYFLDAGSSTDAPRPAFVGGLGDEIERVASVGGEVTLVIPPFGCPTGRVYGAFDALGPGPLRVAAVRDAIGSSLDGGRVDVARLFNDLAVPAVQVEPRLRAYLEAGERLGVQVSGSGSTMFVVDGEPDRVGALGLDAKIVRTRLVV